MGKKRSAGGLPPERRRDPRVVASLGAEMRVGGRAFLASITNLSRGGAFVEILVPDFPAGTRGGTLASAALGEIEVRIRRRRRDAGAVRGLGLEFLSVGDATRALLESYIRVLG